MLSLACLIGASAPHPHSALFIYHLSKELVQHGGILTSRHMVPITAAKRWKWKEEGRKEGGGKLGELRSTVNEIITKVTVIESCPSSPLSTFLLWEDL